MNTNLHSNLKGYTAIAGVVALIAGIVAGLLFLFLPALADTARVLLGVALLFVVVFIVGAFGEVRDAVMARQTKYGTNSLVMVLAFAAIMGVINFLAAQYPMRVDLTAGGQFTLSQHTQNVLKSLNQPVQVTAFFSKGDAPTDAQQAAQLAAIQEQSESLLREYARLSPNFTYRFIDHVADPTMARAYSVTSSGTIVFEQSGRRQIVAGVAEQDFTGGILKVIGLERLKVYYLTGHGEHDLSQRDEQGYSVVGQALDAENYEVIPLDLGGTPQVPANASLVIIASPQKQLLDAEVRALDEYLVNGGKAMFLLDPNPRAELTDLLPKWGVRVAPGQVVSASTAINNLPNAVRIERNQYVFGQITQNLDRSVFPGTAGLTFNVPDNDKDHVVVQPLAGTPSDAFATPDLGRTAFDAAKDVRGPFALALTILADKPVGQRPSQPAPPANSQQAPLRPTRIAVFGDSDFATNRFFLSVGSNSDLFINTVNWLTAQEDLISIRPKPPEFRRLVITASQWTLIEATSVVFWPGLLLVAGAFVWWRRR